MTQPNLVYFLLYNCFKWKKIIYCSVHLHVQRNQQFFNEKFFKYSRNIKDARKYSRITRCFSRIKDKTRFDSKFKDSSWRSRTSGNLTLTFSIPVKMNHNQNF